jgi:hypothetical protein
MSDELEAIERELEAMTPNIPSPQLNAMIGQRLGVQRRSRVHRWRLVVGLAAAATLAIVLVQLSVPRETTRTPQSVRSSQPVEVMPAPAIAPAPLCEYELALAQSPARLDAVLDAQSGTHAHAGGPVVVHAFSQSDLDTFLNH